VTVRVAGTLAAISAALFYGTSWIATGVALQGFSPLSAALWRGFLTAVLLLPAVWRGVSGPASSEGMQAQRRWDAGRIVRYAVLGMLGGVLFVLGMNVSVALNGAAITAFVAGAYPVVAAALSPFFLGERPDPLAMVGLLVCFAGALVIAGFDVGGVNLGGIAVAIGTAVSIGIFLVLSRKWTRSLGLRSTTVAFGNFSMLAGACVILCVVTATPLVPADASVNAWLATFWLATSVGVLGTVLVVESVKRLPASESSAYLMLSPLTAALLAAPVLGEQLSLTQIGGAAVILAGIALATVISPRLAKGAS
jgi:probable blue pigment (indigoidine) exporter